MRAHDVVPTDRSADAQHRFRADRYERSAELGGCLAAPNIRLTLISILHACDCSISVTVTIARSGRGIAIDARDRQGRSIHRAQPQRNTVNPTITPVMAAGGVARVVARSDATRR